MTETVINLLVQIPLAGVVVFVVIKFLDHLDKSNVRQDAAQQRMYTFLSEQEENNRAFMAEQREANENTMERFGVRLESIAAEVQRMNGVLSAHDARSQERNKYDSK